MVSGRIARALRRAAFVSWREQPTQYEIEALRANVERVGLVIRARWTIVAVLAVFSVVAAFFYARAVPFERFVSNMAVPAASLVFVLAYNTFYQLTYRKLANVTFLNHAQLIFDMLVVTVLVYYSGGVYSWFSAMYLLFILEGAFILERDHDVWSLVGISAALYGSVVLAEYRGWIPHVAMPFVENHLWANGTYVVVRYLWELTMCGGAATIGILMMRRIRARERELEGCSFIDELTGLFNRPYFHRVMGSEAERALRDGREVALVVVDIDRLGEVNATFGLDIGDEVLARVGATLARITRERSVPGVFDANVACRIGGEEFAVIVPEVRDVDEELEPARLRAFGIAQALRDELEELRVRGISVTASIGVAVLPSDGTTADELLEAADRALWEAMRSGGDAVVAAWEMEAAVREKAAEGAAWA